MHSVRLGALDFTPVASGQHSHHCLWALTEAAPRLEALGYESLWLGEHHSSAIAQASPELMCAILAGLTSTLRVGAAGILLNLHSPLRIASAFKLLEALYPGRIDLGLARGGVDQARRILLRDGNLLSPEFNLKVIELLSYIRDQNVIRVSPTGTPAPRVWLLGSSKESAHLAGTLSTSFCFAEFFARDGLVAEEVMNVYRSSFTVSSTMPGPECAIAFAGVCGNSFANALKAFNSNGPIRVRHPVLGPAAFQLEHIEDLSLSCGVHHFIFLELSSSPEDRLLGYERLASALRLSPPAD